RRKEAEDGRPARLFDMFRDRVMFPIADTQGHVIAFGARTLGDDEPKYLNSPETPLFSKGRTVYALDLAKREMLRTGEGAVMEGPCDTLFRGGLPALKWCIAPSREAFDHLLAMRRAAFDMKSVPGQAMALDAALEALVPLTNDVRRALYVTRVSEAYRIQEE